MDEPRVAGRGRNTPLTRREMLSYAQIAALVVFVTVAAACLVWVIGLQPEWIDLGRVDELKHDVPTERTTTRRDKSTLTVWVVYTPEQWLVFDGLTPFGPGNPGSFSSHCVYQWEWVTQRFEDPCTGYKFSLTGAFVDPYGQFAGRPVQDLDRYAPSIRDGHLFIDANRVITTEPYIGRGLMSERVH